MKKNIQMILTFGIIIISIVYFYFHHAQFKLLQNLNLKNIVILFGLFFLFFYLSGYIFKLLVSLMGVELSLKETIGLSILTNFGNYLGPTKPGVALKAIYLKSVRNLSYTQFTSVLAANLFLAFFISGLIGFILLLMLENVKIPFVLWLICGGLIIGSVLPFVCNIPQIMPKNKIKKLLQSVLEGFEIIRVKKQKLILICLALISQIFFSALITFFVFHSLGFSISYLAALVIGTFTSISNLFTVTPHNLGIREIISAYLFTITGFNFTNGIIGVTVIRIIEIILTFTLAPLFVHLLLKNTKIKLTNILSGKNTIK